MNKNGRREGQGCKEIRAHLWLICHLSQITLKCSRWSACSLAFFSSSLPRRSISFSLPFIALLSCSIWSSSSKYLYKTKMMWAHFKSKSCYATHTFKLLSIPTSWLSFLSAFSAWYLSSSSSRSLLSLSASSSLSLSWALQLAKPSSTHTNMGTSDSTTPSP